MTLEIITGFFIGLFFGFVAGQLFSFMIVPPQLTEEEDEKTAEEINKYLDSDDEDVIIEKSEYDVEQDELREEKSKPETIDIKEIVKDL